MNRNSNQTYFTTTGDASGNCEEPTTPGFSFLLSHPVFVAQAFSLLVVFSNEVRFLSVFLSGRRLRKIGHEQNIWSFESHPQLLSSKKNCIGHL
jgi:hypothetical protein